MSRETSGAVVTTWVDQEVKAVAKLTAELEGKSLSAWVAELVTREVRNA